MPNPGHKLVWRLYDRRGHATADLLGLDDESPADMEQITLRHPTDQSRFRTMERDEVADIEPLLEDILVEGRLVVELPPLEVLRQRRIADVARLDAGVKRLITPHGYHVSLTQRLWQLKQQLIASATGRGQ